jgi:hypothetical protein
MESKRNAAYCLPFAETGLSAGRSAEGTNLPKRGLNRQKIGQTVFD